MGEARRRGRRDDRRLMRRDDRWCGGTGDTGEGATGGLVRRDGRRREAEITRGGGAGNYGPGYTLAGKCRRGEKKTEVLDGIIFPDDVFFCPQPNSVKHLAFPCGP
jgi:hypothetical protein